MTPEARAQLRARAEYIQTSVQTDERDRFVALSPEDVVALLDALDAAERRAAYAEAYAMSNMTPLEQRQRDIIGRLQQQLDAAKARVAALERERDEEQPSIVTINPRRKTYKFPTQAEVTALQARVAVLTAAIQALKDYSERSGNANYRMAVAYTPEWTAMLAALDAVKAG